jgi:hypothetical protein
MTLAPGRDCTNDGDNGYICEREGDNFENILIFLKTIIEQVSWNKSSLLLNIQKSNAQIFQLFTMIIKIESIQKSN